MSQPKPPANTTTDTIGATLPAGNRPNTTALFPAGSRRERPGTLALTIGFGLVAVCLIGLFTSPTAAIGGAWCIGMMLVLLFLSVPVAIALSVPSIIGVYAVSGVPATMNILATAPFSAVSDWSMSVLPMFIFMGMLLTQSGLSGKVYRVADHWFSWLPGGIGIGTTFAGAGLSAVTGSTIGMTYALGRAGIPEMLKAGYDRRMAVGTIMVSGMTGNLIPPSILMVVYAGIASVPVGPALMAGALPGIVLAVCFAAFIFAIGVAAPKLVGRGQKADITTRPATTWRDRFTSLASVWGFAIILIVLFGGMFSGIFTPTEAGAAAALCSLLLCLWEKRSQKPWRKVADSAMATVAATSAIFFIMIGATMLTSLLAITGLAPHPHRPHHGPRTVADRIPARPHRPLHRHGHVLRHPVDDAADHPDPSAHPRNDGGEPAVVRSLRRPPRRVRHGHPAGRNHPLHRPFDREEPRGQPRPPREPARYLHLPAVVPARRRGLPHPHGRRARNDRMAARPHRTHQRGNVRLTLAEVAPSIR